MVDLLEFWNYSENILAEPLTKNGIISLNHFKAAGINWSVRDRILWIKVWDWYDDIIHYFFSKYYVEEVSLIDISKEIGVPKKTISNWFSNYFWWKARPFIWTHTESTRMKRRVSMMKNKNGIWYHGNCRERVEGIVSGIEKPEVSSKKFDYSTYQWYKQWFRKINMILEYSWYWIWYLDILICELKAENYKAPIISHIINSLVVSLISIHRLRIETPPEVNRVTIHNKMNKNSK